MAGNNREEITQTILVVDDNRDLVDLYITILTMEGYTIVSAYSGRQCLEILKTMVPDLILLDIMMSPMDGWETLVNIRSNPATPDIPVIMVTGKQFVFEELEKFGNYIDGYVIKPISPRKLNALIEEFLARKSAIGHEVEKAEKSGIKSEIINEFRELSIRVPVMKSLIEMIEDAYHEGHKSHYHDEQKEKITAMLETLRRREARLHEIQGIFAGVTTAV
jgi:Response regulator containing CheY-like receiver, AAA-type ATPase, and DNA-binding domains